eukprot:CAMPEP_0177642022 /NCGR_PEP_ID=MMETSP0447-20121125/7369_1 /TAXON_ID=0 /ORGANISM="Stygamoeba regulata, Strain BSH-02190019" /LENGTH=39 /DNA_ID= /DNA_START= /DNA_END= /DNA_ORIENTATION=
MSLLPLMLIEMVGIPSIILVVELGTAHYPHAGLGLVLLL